MLKTPFFLLATVAALTFTSCGPTEEEEKAMNKKMEEPEKVEIPKDFESELLGELEDSTGTDSTTKK